MKVARRALGFVVVLTTLLVWPVFVWAQEGEHKDLAGTEEGPGKALGAAPAVSEMDEVAILTEAAAVLDLTHPDLAAKLRALAANEENEKGKAAEGIEKAEEAAEKGM